MSEWTKTLATIAGSGAIASFLTYFLSNRKQAHNEFLALYKEHKLLYDELKKDHDLLKIEVKAIRKQLQESEKETTTLRHQLMIFEGSHGDIPLPIWLKDTNGVMLYLNDEYERRILQPIGLTKEDYIGRTDFDVWDKHIAQNFVNNDLEVMRRKKPVEFDEEWSSGSQGFIGKLIKYPRFMNSGSRTVIGIGGTIIDIKML